MTETSTATHTPSTINTKVLDAVVVVEAADMFGLPAPFYVSFDTHGVETQVRSYDEFTTWAEHLAADVTKILLLNGDAHYVVTGELAGVTVEVNVVADSRADQ